MLRLIKAIVKIPAGIALGMIWFYRKAISPMLPPTCRFHPTCSQYASEAYKRHGFFKGSWLTFVRILKCQPFYKGNHIDPVPPVESSD